MPARIIFESRALAGSIRPEQPIKLLARFNAKIEIAHRNNRLVGAREKGNFRQSGPNGDGRNHSLLNFKTAGRRPGSPIYFAFGYESRREVAAGLTAHRG